MIREKVDFSKVSEMTYPFQKEYDENRNSDVSIIVIHGGEMENGTDWVAKEIANDGWYNFYLFKILGMDTFEKYHKQLNSTTFNDKLCLDIVKKSQITVSLHGHSAKDNNTIYIGGADIYLRKILSENLKEFGFDVPDFGDIGKHLLGISSDNIINKNQRKKGIQMELSNKLRKNLKSDYSLRKDFNAQIIKSIHTINRRLDNEV